MSKRKAEQDEWELHKDEIDELFLTEDQTLLAVKEIMDGRGFKRTKAQYERMFKQWDFRKNFNKNEQRYLLAKLQQRQANGKQSMVKFKGARVSESRLAKIQGRAHESLHDRLFSGPRPRTPSTPPEVSVVSPTPTLHDVSDAFEASFLRWARNAPSFVFATIFSQPRPSDSPQIPSISRWETSDLTIVPAQQSVHIMSLFKSLPSYDTSPYCITSLIEHTPSTSSALAQQIPDFKIWMSVIQAVSNGRGCENELKALIDLAQDKNILRFLRSFLKQDLISIRIFKDKLFEMACVVHDITLIDVLIQAGVNINQPDIISHLWRPLEKAVYYDDERLVESLVLRCAKSWWNIKERNFIFLRRGAIGNNNERILRLLLEQESTHRKSVDFLDELCFALKLRNIRCARTLLKLVQGLRAEALRAPWLIVEAALSANYDNIPTPSSSDESSENNSDIEASEHQSTYLTLNQGLLKETLDFLEEEGIDFLRKDLNGYGSALAAAALRGNIELCKYILSLGVDPNSVAFGCSHGRYAYGDCFSLQSPCYELGSIRGLSALHVACLRGFQDLVDTLLVAGANSNLGCPVYPIQIASWNGDMNVLKSLLLSGAGVAATSAGSTYKLGEKNWVSYCSDQPAIVLAACNHKLDAFEFLLRCNAWTPEVARSWGSAILRSNITWSMWDYHRHPDFWSAMKPFWTSSHAALLVRLMGWEFATNFFQDSESGNAMLLSDEVTEVACEHPDIDFIDWILQSMHTTFDSSDLVTRGRLVRAMKASFKQGMDSELFHRLLRADVNPFQSPDGTEDDTDAQIERWYDWTFRYRFDGQSPFQAALEPLRLAEVHTMLSWARNQVTGTSQTYQQRELYTAGLYAKSAGNLELQRILEAAGFHLASARAHLNPTYFESLMDFCLLTALRFECYSCAKDLLLEGADANVATAPNNARWWHTPLQYASEADDIGLVQMLLERRAVVNSKPRYEFGATALQFAAMNGNFQILKLLLQAGANINAPPGKAYGRSAIEGAAEWGRVDMVAFLLEAGADIRGKENTNYRKTIHRAWNKGHVHLVQMTQDWKKERYGAEDCESIEVIMETMTDDELVRARNGDEDEEMDHTSGSSSDEEESAFDTSVGDEDVLGLEPETQAEIVETMQEADDADGIYRMFGIIS